MTHEDFNSWLEAYGHAWETLNAEAAANLFRNDAEYFEMPFVEPLRGREEIFRYWTHVSRSQKKVRFNFKILSCTGDFGIAHWQATFTRFPAKTQVKLDGIFVIRLDAEGRCTSLREWWHRKHSDSDPSLAESP